MPSLFVIGLPKGIATRVVSGAATNAFNIESILSDRNDAGELQLVPTELTAIYPLQVYTQDKALETINVLVLPYTKIPQNLRDELEVLEECGGTIEWTTRGKDGWPRLGGAPDAGFLDNLFKTFQEKYFPNKAPTPSEHFRALAQSNARFLVTDGSLDECDDVPNHRRKFLIRCADSCSELVELRIEESLENYFEKRGLTHAQNGKEKGTLTITKGGKEVYGETRETHLKQGDNTSRQNATRVYYHYLSIEKFQYVGILHAGPHPTGDMTRGHILS